MKVVGSILFAPVGKSLIAQHEFQTLVGRILRRPALTPVDYKLNIGQLSTNHLNYGSFMLTRNCKDCILPSLSSYFLLFFPDHLMPYKKKNFVVKKNRRTDYFVKF